MKKLLLICFLLSPVLMQATVITVPLQYSDIQLAIDAAVDGDTVEVSQGTYYENLNFRGKNILLTSLYYLAADTSYITTTIINGSTPVHPDTASCVIFANGEDSTAILQGFTLTGGAGTKWMDIHNTNFYREGGGILIEFSSPTIRNNIIINNHITNAVGVASTGGGGIRMGDSNPLIQNNIIMMNEGIYGPGIVMNYSGGTIRNNIIASNYGGQNYYGGSGIWMIDNFGTTPKIIENNTIVNNTCAAANGTGGILVWGSTNVFIKNNIIRDNTPAQQIKILSTTADVTYNVTSGNVTGNGNIFTDPILDPLCLIPDFTSIAIDNGDSSTIYNDNTISPGVALPPSQGAERNDIGVTGGPYATIMNCVEAVSSLTEKTKNTFSLFPNPAGDYVDINSSTPFSSVEILDINGRTVERILNNSANTSMKIAVKHLKVGVYFLKVVGEGSVGVERMEVVR